MPKTKHSGAVEFEFVDPKRLPFCEHTKTQWNKLKSFSESFNHELNANATTIILQRDHQWFAYAQVCHYPTCFFAWHTDPAVCSKRDIIEGIQHFRGYVKLQHGIGFTAVSHNNAMFTPEFMERMGVRRMNMEIYEV